jgi:hypothetical protein
MEVNIKEAQQAPAQQQKGSRFWGVVTILVVLLLFVVALSRLALDLGWYTPAWMQAALTPQPVAPTIRTLPADPAAPRPQPAQQQGQVVATTVPLDQAQPAAAPAVQADPAAPAPVVEEYVPPAEPIVQPTAGPWYAETIKDYSDRPPCSMPRANPATCASGEVPDLPWPNGRNP